jgi:hypothetical protein
MFRRFAKIDADSTTATPTAAVVVGPKHPPEVTFSVITPTFRVKPGHTSRPHKGSIGGVVIPHGNQQDMEEGATTRLHLLLAASLLVCVVGLVLGCVLFKWCQERRRSRQQQQQQQQQQQSIHNTIEAPPASAVVDIPHVSPRIPTESSESLSVGSEIPLSMLDSQDNHQQQSNLGVENTEQLSSSPSRMSLENQENNLSRNSSVRSSSTDEFSRLIAKFSLKDESLPLPSVGSYLADPSSRHKPAHLPRIANVVTSVDSVEADVDAADCENNTAGVVPRTPCDLNKGTPTPCVLENVTLTPPSLAPYSVVTMSTPPGTAPVLTRPKKPPTPSSRSLITSPSIFTFQYDKNSPSPHSFSTDGHPDVKRHSSAKTKTTPGGTIKHGPVVKLFMRQTSTEHTESSQVQAKTTETTLTPYGRTKSATFSTNGDMAPTNSENQIALLQKEARTPPRPSHEKGTARVDGRSCSTDDGVQAVFLAGGSGLKEVS